MKRFKIILAIVVAGLALLFVLALKRPKAAVQGPRYVVVTTQPTGPFAMHMYNWGEAVPFQDGRTWVTLVALTGTTNREFHRYLYDLNLRQVVGEMQNGAEIFSTPDRNLMLCIGPSMPSLVDKLKALATRLTGGKLTFTRGLPESFWVLDVRDNSSVHIGGFNQAIGTGSRWIPAPGFRLAYNRPSTSARGDEFYLCDMDQKQLRKVLFKGDLLGWWDDHQVLARDSAGDFQAYDVKTGQTSNVFTAQTIARFLTGFGLTNDSAGIAATPEWNGRDYDWYFSGNRRNGIDTNSTYLLKAERSAPSLKLLSRDFQFRWSGHFDATGTHLMFSGENGTPGSGGNGGIFLRDLTNNVTRTLVPPWHSNQYALARQEGDTIIYSSNRILWRVDIRTTNAELLFPLLPKSNSQH